MRRLAAIIKSPEWLSFRWSVYIPIYCRWWNHRRPPASKPLAIPAFRSWRNRNSRSLEVINIIYILIHIYIYIYTHTHTRTRTHTHTHAHPASTSTSKYTYNIIIYIISYTYRIYADTYTSTYTYTYTCVLKEGSIISESHLKRWIEMVSCKHSDQFQFQSTVIHSSGLQWSSLGRLRQTWQNHRSWLANPRTQWKLTSYSRDNTIPYHYITLHYTTLHYITVHYSTLQYITIHTIHDNHLQIGEFSSPDCCTSSATMLLWNW